MTKARDLADLISTGNTLADGSISVSEVSGAAPTASPTFTGTVNVDGAAQIRGVTVEDSSGTTKGYVQGDADGLLIASDGTNNITFDVNAAERMRIDSNGRVGIGVTSMNDATLEIQPASDIPQIKLTQNNVPDGGDGWKFHNSGPTGGNLAIIREGSGVDTEHMRITTSGNVGIGTSSFPANGTNLKVEDATISRLVLANTGDSTFEIGSLSGGDLNIYDATADAERFRVGSSGQLGIGGANYGTSGQVLTSGGSGAAPTWADAGGGAFEVVSDTSFSNASDKEFTITAGRVYKFEFLGITVNNTIGGSQMLWRASSNGGVSFAHTIYYSIRRSYSAATSFSTTNGNGTYGSLTYYNAPQSNTNAGTFVGEMFYYQRSGYSPMANSVFQQGDNTPGTSLGGFRIGTTSTINRLRFQPNSDTITGRIRVLRSV